VWEGEEWHVRLEVRVGTLTLELDSHTYHTSEIGWDYEKKRFFGYCSEKKNDSQAEALSLMTKRNLIGRKTSSQNQSKRGLLKLHLF
jgi:hypothetical protein